MDGWVEKWMKKKFKDGQMDEKAVDKWIDECMKKRNRSIDGQMDG